MRKLPPEELARHKREYNREYRRTHRERFRERSRAAYVRLRESNLRRTFQLRLQSLRHYGGNPPSCACCGETELEFLSIDHKNGGGGKHRKQVGSGVTFHYWLRRNGFPNGYQILCHNCNQAKGYYGGCPHMRIGDDT